MNDDLIKLSDFIKFCKETQIAQKSERTLYRYFHNGNTSLEIKKIGRNYYITKESLIKIDQIGYKNFKKFLMLYKKIDNKTKKENGRKNKKIKIILPQLCIHFLSDIRINKIQNFIETFTFVDKEIELSPNTYSYLKNKAKQYKMHPNNFINQFIMLLLLKEINNQLK